MQSRVQKWGNSLGVRLPAPIAKRLRLHKGSPVEIVSEKDCISIYPHKYNLDDMVEQISDSNLHSILLDDKKNKGNEQW